MKLTKKMVFGAVLVAIFGFIVVLLVQYRFKPTAGAVFLLSGWLSILACSWFLAMAVRALAHTQSRFASELISERRRRELLLEKDALLRAIKDVEFDKATGKVEEEDAQEGIREHRSRALAILEELDADKSYEDVIATELAKRLPKGAVCLGCKTTNDNDAVFCKKCGAKLAEVRR